MTARARNVLTAALAAVGVAVFAYIGRLLAGGADGMAPVWFANVVVLAAMLRFPTLHRGALLSGAAAGLIVAMLLTGAAGGHAPILAALNLGEIALGAIMFKRFADRSLPLYAPRNLSVWFGGPSLIAPAVFAVAGGLIGFNKATPIGVVALRWFAAHSLGMIVIGPLVLAAACSDCLTLFRSPRRHEIALALAGSIGVTLVVFEQARYPALFLILPVLTIAIFRLRFIGAASGIVAVAIVASLETLRGHGPIAEALPDASERILFLQIFLAVIVIANFPVAAILVERESTNRRLVEEERRFRRMTEAAPVAMFRTDAGGRIIYGNERWQDLIGRRAGEPWFHIVAPEGRSDALLQWTDMLDRRETFSAEVDAITDNSDCAWMSLTMSPDVENGRVVGWTGIAINVEERRRAERRIADSERQYRLIADHSNDMIVRLGLDGVRRYVSPASRAILGYEPEELIGETSMTAIHAEDRARVERVCRSLLDGTVEPTCSYRQRRRDGTYAWLEATYRLVRDANGAPTEFVASVRDIGERRSAELETASAMARLEESNRLLSMAEKLAGVGHWRLDAITHDLIWSDEVYHIHGRQIGDIPPLTEAINLYHPDDRPRVQSHVDAALSHGASWAFKARILRPDGDLRHVESSGQAERAPDGTVIGIVGVFRDITPEVDSASALVAARDEAKASAEAKSAFLATMSHEIRTPMTGVLGMIELLRTDLSPADRKRFFDNLEQSATLLMTVLDDVLDFSKIESRNLVLEHVDFDLGELARNTIDLFHHAASRKGLIVSLSAPVGRDMMVRGDPIRLQQVMSNFISNAIKFTNSGKVELRIELQPHARKRHVRIEVVDTGVGIAHDAINRLFEPFIQADISTTRRFGGTGLGLAISKRLVEAMHGEIGVESVEGQGTTFHVAVTLDAGAERPSRAVPARKTVARPLSILLAEDNQINRALVEALVRKEGHRIRSVENGRLAVEAAASEPFDVILMDMQMPEMDGLAATRTIREGGGRSAGAPIIALTADASAERRRFYDHAGLTEFLTKPINSDLLSERLRQIANEEVGAIAPAPP